MQAFASVVCFGYNSVSSFTLLQLPKHHEDSDAVYLVDSPISAG